MRISGGQSQEMMELVLGNKSLVLWRTRQESNLRPSVPQTVLVGIQGKTATNKGNNINNMMALHCCHMSPNMACFCKLMAQNWHIFRLVRAE